MDEIQDATALPQADDRLAGELFAVYDREQYPSRMKEFMARIGTERTPLAQVDDEVFYPALSAGAGRR